MALYSKSQLRLFADAYKRNTGQATLTAHEILKRRTQTTPPDRKYDMFLSHSYSDALLVLGIVLELQDLGYIAYVDWTEDTDLKRNEVSKETADRLRQRMHNCKSLFYATSDHSQTSKWMPWEAGYFDGIKQKVAILPVLDVSQTINKYEGQEYLGLYPFISKNINPKTQKPALFVHEDEHHFTLYDLWVMGQK